jgi:ABC-type nitrate/sulfonate/bicarbonate transport system substrate-binding protein
LNLSRDKTFDAVREEAMPTLTVSRLCAALVVALLASLRACPAAAADMTALKVGISEPVNTVLALWMAEAGGFYAGQGLKVEIINMSGGSRGAEALQAGRIDVMHVGLSSVVRLNRAGADLRTIASLSNVIRFTFFSAPGVKTAADLKGGVVGVSSFGSESDATVTLALQKLGLTRDDVTLKEYGGGTRRLAALKAGEIKATAINEPVASTAREEGLNAMVDLAVEQIPWLFSGLVVKRSYLEGNRELLARFLKATIEGNHLALTDATRAKEVLARETKITDRKIIDIGYSDFTQQTPVNTEPSRRGAENIIAQFPDGVSRKVEDYVDTGILDGLERDGFFASLEQKYGKR